MKKLKLKELCSTCWSSRIDAVRALKNPDADDSKERADALMKNIDNFNFVVRAKFDFSSSFFFHKSFRPLTLIFLMVNCNTCMILGALFCILRCSQGIKPEFTDKRQRRKKKFHDQ